MLISSRESSEGSAQSWKARKRRTRDPSAEKPASADQDEKDLRNTLHKTKLHPEEDHQRNIKAENDVPLEGEAAPPADR